uniref:Ig-like domain-containing protein n=1 Tax=Suricata suricatta TaxID=37032 RepID=A0A673THI5_SURSU
LLCSALACCGEPTFVSFSIGSGMAEKVIQNQTTVIIQEGKTATMECQYETSWSNYYTLYWYKQPPGGGMHFLIYQDASKPSAKQGHLSMNFQKEAKSITLSISFVQLADSAVYFCVLGSPTVIKIIVEDEQKPWSSTKAATCSEA